MTDFSYIDRNVESVRRRIRAAAEAVGRREEDITLLAAVKYATSEEIAHLYDCGIRVIGENRVQQLCEHAQSEDYNKFKVHFIGSLQTNKVKYIAGKVGMIESLDSLRLAAEIDKQSAKAKTVSDVLCEINIGREENKSGILEEHVPEFCAKLAEFKNLRLCGFMTMAPAACDSNEYRKYFAQTYRIAIDIWSKNIDNISGNTLKKPLISMGMSGSFEEAVLEGADVVRVGRGLFQK